MKTENVIMLATVLVLAGMMGMSAMKTRIAQHQQEIVIQQAEIDRLEAWRYWTQIAALPPPYHQPLDQLWVSSGTGYRTNPMGGGEIGLHRGVDLAAPEGTPVYAVIGGIVQEHYVPPDGEKWKGHYALGGAIFIENEDGLFSIFGHLSKTYVHEGDYVEAGQLIAEVGSTGMSTASHLHWEIIVSPLKYFGERR